MDEPHELSSNSPESADDAMALTEKVEAEALATAARATRLRRTAQGTDEVDADDDEDPEAVESEPTLASPSWRQRLWMQMPALSTIAKVVAAALICTFAGLSGYMVWHHDAAKDREQRAAAFIAGAKQGVVNIISLDFSKAKEDVQRVIDSSTGEFRDDFQQRAGDFTKVVEQSKVVTEGTVNAAAIESMDEHSALVLVSATSHVTNSPNPNAQPQLWRLKVTVSEDGGQYKMSKVEFVP